LDKKYVTQNYGAYPIVLDRGEGVNVWDVEGKKYLDFIAGFGSTN